MPSSTGKSEVVPSWPKDIRLVDESSVNFGRLQMNFREKWRGICANFEKYVKSSRLHLYEFTKSAVQCSAVDVLCVFSMHVTVLNK